jgi:hypothetical protein
MLVDKKSFLFRLYLNKLSMGANIFHAQKATFLALGSSMWLFSGSYEKLFPINCGWFFRISCQILA